MKVKRVSDRNWYYYIAFTIYLCLLFIPQTELRIRLPQTVQKAMQLGRYGCYVVFTARICSIRFFERKRLYSCIIAAVCVAMCALAAKNRQNMFVLLITVAAYKSDSRKLVRCATWVFGIGLLMTLLLCRMGIFENQILSGGRNRYNLGFNWVTLGPIYMLFISLGYVILRREEISLFEIMAMEAIAIYLFKSTDARMSFFMNTAFLVVIAAEKMLFKNQWKLVRKARYAVCVLPIAVCLFVIILQVAYQPGIRAWDRLNSMLSNRLLQTKEAFQMLPIRPFGQVIKWEGFSLGEDVLSLQANFRSNNVDCSYLRILLQYGYVGLALVLFVYTCGMYKAVKADDAILVCCYAVVLAFSAAEQWLIELSFNPFVVVAAASLKPIIRKSEWWEKPFNIEIRTNNRAID